MSLRDVKAQQSLFPGQAVALDIIAWAAVAELRLGLADDLLATFPRPDLLETPGWYTEPLFRKAERYWDGDWTDRCRTPQGESSVPL